MDSDTSVIFAKTAPIQLKLASGNDVSTHRKHPDVHVAVSLKSVSRKRTLAIQLTDENDPFFFFDLEINDEEFHALKQEQNLLVDFLQFPAKFVELLEACISCRNDDHPKFMAQLASETSSRYAVLSVIETNSFKHINHLNLNFIPGNDSAIKQYLAALTKELKIENKTYKEQLENQKNALSRNQKQSDDQIQFLNSELERLRLSSSEATSSLLLKAQEELSREKERFLREREEIIMNFERERRALESQFEQEIKSQTRTVTALNTSQSHLQSQVQTLEINLSSSNKQIEFLTKEVSTYKFDLEKENALKKQIEREKSLLQQEYDRIKEQVELVFKTKAETDEKYRQIDMDYQLLKSQKDQFDEKQQDYKRQIQEIEEELKNASEEINKGNDIIRKLQGDLKTVKAKNKVKNQLALHQEQLLDERAKTIENQQQELNSYKSELEKLKQEMVESKQEIEKLVTLKEENEKKIKEQNNVVEWLHKQLNEKELSGAARYEPRFDKSSPLGNKMGALNTDENMSTKEDVIKTSPSQFRTSIRDRSPGLGMRSRFAASMMNNQNNSRVSPSTASKLTRPQTSATNQPPIQQGVFDPAKIKSTYF